MSNPTAHPTPEKKHNVDCILIKTVHIYTYTTDNVYIYNLVGGFNHLETYYSVGKDYPIYYGK